MQDTLKTIEEIDQTQELQDFAWDVFENAGVVRHSYHLAPPLSEPNSNATEVFAVGFCERWQELYSQAEFRQSDPIPDRTMRYGAMLTWKAAMKLQPNTFQQEAYFFAMRAHGLIHGFGVPLYGPYNRHSCASFDFDRPLSEVQQDSLASIRVVAQAAHQRICVLLEDQDSRPRLTRRERDVLGWIAQGKSVSTIAIILGISPETVKTYVKRIYGKLDKSDRVGATVEAIKLDLIRL